MLWNYKEFKNSLKYHEDNSKRLTYTNYIEIYGDNLTIESEPFYTEYLSKFKPLEYCIDESLANEFDFELLLRLTVGSFSSEYEFQFEEKKTIPELLITVSSGNQKISKKISELFCFQITRMFEIYVEEQMNLATLLTDLGEKLAIEGERQMRITRYQDRLNEIAALTGYKNVEKISNRIDELLKK
jgi:hypothetical protein